MNNSLKFQRICAALLLAAIVIFVAIPSVFNAVSADPDADSATPETTQSTDPQDPDLSNIEEDSNDDEVLDADDPSEDEPTTEDDATQDGALAEGDDASENDASETDSSQDSEGSEPDQPAATAAEDDGQEDSAVQTMQISVEEAEEGYIYFDLAAGNVTINGNTYTGYIFENGDKKKVTGLHSADNKYYIYQSNDSCKDTTGLVNGKMYLPAYDEVTYGGKAWSEYITNNSSVEDVISNWTSAAESVGRTDCGYHVTISGNKNVAVVFDNLWSVYATNSNNDGPVKVSGLSNKANVTVKLKGDSRFRNIYYQNNSSTNGCKLTIDSASGEGKTSGSMTVAAYVTKLKRDNSSSDWPDSLAVIGAANNAEYGLTFSGGTVFAGFPAQTNHVWDERGTVAFATCVGGGNNKPGEVTINGGRLTAISNGTSTAIGGGGGYKLTGDPGTVYINGGETYAYSFGIYSIFKDYYGFVPTTTIGGSSTFNGNANAGTKVEITGGYVYASSVGGTAIGGGGSRNGTGGNATVNISGGEVIAESIEADVCTDQEDTSKITHINRGNAIGGGVGTAGGAATVVVTGGSTTCTAIGGGSGSTGNGGDATVYITNGTLKTGTVGGGTSTSALIGYARAYISGGDIQGQFLLQGVLGDGATDAEITKKRCEFIMTGGIIHDVSAQNPTYIDLRQPYGGAVWMNDQYGVVTISGGTISNCSAVSGGAIYMSGGTFTLTGNGVIKDCKTKGTVTEADGEVLEKAKQGRGGAVYLGGGRAIVGVDRKLSVTNVEEGTCTTQICSYYGLEETKDSSVPLKKVNVTINPDPSTSTPSPTSEDDNNEAASTEGIVYVKDISCSISGCRATYGGALYVAGYTDDQAVTTSEDDIIKNASIDPQNYNVYVSAGTLEGNTATESGGAVCVNNGHVLMDGGKISSNTAHANGGAIYLSSQAAKEARVRIRSGEISSNVADGTSTTKDASTGNANCVGVGNGGAIAVAGNGDVPIKVVIGVNESHFKNGSSGVDDKNFVGCDHVNDNEGTDPCPVIQDNNSTNEGGAIHISGESNTYLNIYCIEEEGNAAKGDTDGTGENIEHLSNFMMIEGGTVIITTGDKANNSDAEEGYSRIKGTTHVVGGTLDLYGRMENPKIEGMITVDLQSADDHFIDHRVHTEADGSIIYWVHYIENFLTTDEYGNEYRTGRLKAIPVEQGGEGDAKEWKHTIKGSLFDRPGYSIQGWYTTSDGADSVEKDANGNTVTKTANAYGVGVVYSFPDVKNHTETTVDANGASSVDPEVSDLIDNDPTDENTQLTTLVLYAIWIQDSYTVQYDANAESYTGTTNDSTFSMNENDENNKVSECGYTRPDGYKFVGWNTEPDGTGSTTYKPGDVVTSPLAEKGAAVTLYAQWEPCDHKNLTYSNPSDSSNDPENPDTITQKCSDCGHTATATVKGFTLPYDGQNHADATVEISGDWIGDVPSVTYVMNASEDWDEKDDAVSRFNSSKMPVDAGSYTAKIQCGETDAAATAKCEITRIKWSAPDAPQVQGFANVNEDNTIKVTSPINKKDDSYNYMRTDLDGCNNIYQYKYSTGNSDEGGSWQTDSAFNVTSSYAQIYYFQVKQAEDRNHEESKPSESYVYITSNGVIVHLEAGEGIEITPESQTAGNAVVVERFSVTTKYGYHFRNYGYTVKVGENVSDANTIGMVVSGDESSGYSYSLKGLGSAVLSNAEVYIYCSGAAKDATMAAAVLPGQKFAYFENVDTNISSDSAFTARFAVSDLIPAEYEVPALQFSAALPKGTTVIMMADGGYYYYIVSDDKTTSIGLASFTQMGATGTYSCDPTSEVASSVTYQFIVDFSQVDSSSLLTASEYNADLVLTPSEGSNAPALPAADNSGNIAHQLTLSLKSPAKFTLSASENDSMSGTVKATFTPSEGYASIWENRTTSLVLTPTSTTSVPKDLLIVAEAGGKSYKIQANKNGQFVIPSIFSNLAEAGTKDRVTEVNLTLESDLLSDKATYAFDATWWVSDSAVGASPLNGYRAASSAVSFTYSGVSPSVKIEVANNKRIYGAKDEFAATVKYMNLPENAVLEASIEQKTKDGDYESMGSLDTLSKSNGLIISEGVTSYSLPSNLSGVSAQNLRLLVTVKVGNITILQTPYYFYIPTT